MEEITNKVIEPYIKDFAEFSTKSLSNGVCHLAFKYATESCCQIPIENNLAPDIFVKIYYPYTEEGDFDYDPEKNKVVGTMHLALINIEACRSYDQLIENVFADGYDRLLFNKVFDYENNDYLPDWSDIVDGLRSPNVLYIESLFLKKDFRSNEIGQIILEELKLKFCGMFAYLITEALPMQHRRDAPEGEDWDWSSMEQDYDRAEAMYFQFLRETGLRQHQDTDLFFTEGATIL